MKKLVVIAFLFYSSVNFAQITLEHSYAAPFTGWTQTGPSTWNYYTADASNISVYDITHSLVISVVTPTIPNFTFESVYYVSNSLFNNSGNWAWVINYMNNTTKPYEYLLTVYDQTGTQLLRIDSSYGATPNPYYGYSIFNTSSGSKMLCNLYSWTSYKFYGANVYSLGGTYYAALKPIAHGDESVLSPYPNPSNDMIHLTYNLPAGTNQAEMVITNISGQVVKTCNVGNAFNDILFDTKTYSSGVYLYYIQADNYTSPTSKFIINR